MSKIILKNKEEISKMEEGGRRLASVLMKLEDHIKNKKTTGKELENIANELAKKLDGKPSFKGYKGYPASLCVSVNDEVVHGIPTSDTFNEGDLVKIDFGLWYKDLCTDSALTCPVGEIKEEDKKLIEVTKNSLQMGIDQAVIGNKMGAIGSVIEGYVKENNFSVVKELVGHGVGKKVHEAPQIPNFGRAEIGDKIEEGMTLAIEPMVNVGGFRIKFESDGWTVKTVDGTNSAHFEHSIAITLDGPIILTER